MSAYNELFTSKTLESVVNQHIYERPFQAWKSWILPLFSYSAVQILCSSQFTDDSNNLLCCSFDFYEVKEISRRITTEKIHLSVSYQALLHNLKKKSKKEKIKSDKKKKERLYLITTQRHTVLCNIQWQCYWKRWYLLRATYWYIYTKNTPTEMWSSKVLVSWRGRSSETWGMRLVDCEPLIARMYVRHHSTLRWTKCIENTGLMYANTRRLLFTSRACPVVSAPMTIFTKCWPLTWHAHCMFDATALLRGCSM